MKKLFLSLVFIFSFNFLNAQSSNTIWTFGPMFHFYFGKHFDFTMGLEAAMWKDKYSIDFGVEGFNNKHIIIYSEYQKGSHYDHNSLPFIYGASIGPCVEIRDDSLSYVHLGVQGSGWAAWLFGIDARVRYTEDRFTFSPGTFFKIPFGAKLSLGD